MKDRQGRPADVGPLACVSAGDRGAPALLFLHGFMGRGRDWLPVMTNLRSRWYCLAPDLPGHGASTGLHEGAYAMEGAASMVLDLMDRHGLETAALAGYSMGGRLALYLALRHPTRWSKVCLESASPGLEDARARAARRAEDWERANRIRTDFPAFLDHWFRQPLFASLSKRPDLVARLWEDRLGQDPVEIAKALDGMGTGSQPSLWAELPGLRAETLALAGALDPQYVGIARRMAGRNALINVEVVPDVGHNVHAECRGAYLTVLNAFMRKNRV